MKYKNLLIIAQRFPSKESTNFDGIFIKEQLEFIKKYFENIYVVVPTPQVPKFLMYIPGVPKVWRDFSTKQDYAYGNVHVFFPKFFILPIISKKSVERKMLDAASKTIEKEGLLFDVIHAHFTYPAGYIGAVIKKTSKKPLVITVHEDAEWLKKEMLDVRCVSTWNAADAIIRVSENDINLFHEKNLNYKINYIPNGYDPLLFKHINRSEARKTLGIESNKKILLNIGRLEERKGQKLLIAAVKLLKQKYENIHLIILGEGPLKHEIEKEIRLKKVSDSVFLAGGNKKREEIPLWINASDIFVLSSYSEGNPTVMFEALGCCIPYVGPRVGGSSSIIKSPDVGQLFNAGNVDDLIKALEFVINKSWDKKKIRAYAEQYSWKAIANKIKQVYDEVTQND